MRMLLTAASLLLQFSHRLFKTVTEEKLIERGMGMIHCICPGKGKERKDAHGYFFTPFTRSMLVSKLYVRPSPVSKVSDM